MNKIRELVEKMEPLERAAFVYTGDLYQVRQLNQEFTRKFITDLSRRGDHDTDWWRSGLSCIKSMNLSSTMRIKSIFRCWRVRGKDYDKLAPDEQFILYNTAINIVNTIEHYKPFLAKAFFLTRNSPPTMASLPNMIRRAVVLSDTDSTMFSVDGWVKWYYGGYWV